jgi:hypothetical protein
MCRLTASIVVAFYASTLALPVQAQAVRVQIPVVTRLVQTYSDYEERLVEAINRKDTTEIDRLVAPNFELRSANNIGVPTPRADWIAQSLKERPTTMSVGQMAVHDYGNIRVVSFVMKPTGTFRREPAIAVVDVWLQSAGSSILQTRYATVQTVRSLRVPGETQQKKIDKRY